MKFIKWITYFLGLVITLLSSCKIEPPLIYSKNYSVGYNDLLRFDGYYIDSELLTTYKKENKDEITILTSPLFFYEDGTVKIWSGLKNELVADSLLLENKKWGFTGIYKIVNDNLYLEYWIGDSGTGNLNRRSLVLKITDDKLVLVGELNDKKEVISLNDKYKRTFLFRKNLIKPIVKKNWIQERKKWNK